MAITHEHLVVHAGHLIHWWDGDSASSFPIIISNSPVLLDSLYAGIGSHRFSPMECEWCGRSEPFETWQRVGFNGAAGWRLREQLREVAGARWRWLRACRTREFRACWASSGGVDIPVEAVWMANHPGMPYRADWDDRLHQFGGKEFALGNEGLIRVDVSRVSGIDGATSSDWLAIVSRLLRDPAMWQVIGRNEGRYDIRLHGTIGAFMDAERSLRVRWSSRANRSCIVRIEAPASMRSS